jgi:hypothetical protein
MSFLFKTWTSCEFYNDKKENPGHTLHSFMAASSQEQATHTHRKRRAQADKGGLNYEKA